ncbi:MAG: glycoside hydrolase family 88 protein [Sphaerochaetaceae bacterium]|jgi:unsaturated chondroitin disaccharide hydrolase
MNMQPITDKEREEALGDALSIIRRNIPRYTDHCQNHSSVRHWYPQCENDQWTTGFWPGELWLSWELTHDDAFRICGERFVDSFDTRIRERIAVDNHDMGFLYTPSCVAPYLLTGNEKAKEAAILAARQLASRFQKVGRFIQAWGPMGQRENYRYIIDCLLNLPLLYWATDTTGEGMFREIAIAHTQTCIAHSFRPDHSTYHTFFMDPITGKGVRGETCQGYRADSSWARGQAWAVYGLALSYKYSRDPSLLVLFDGVADYFLSRLPQDMIPYWDLIFQNGNEPRDSSAASIVACGLLEMASLRAERQESYTLEAKRLVGSLVRSYRVRKGDDANGLVYHGTYSKKSPYNSCTEEGVDECVSWGDYFYLEALMRLGNPSWREYW